MKVGLILLLAVCPLAAQPDPCTEDSQRFCANIAPGGGRTWDCLQAHASELSAACSNYVKGASQEPQGLRAVCADDTSRYCPDAKSTGQLRRCLREHYDRLSPSCSAKIPQLTK